MKAVDLFQYKAWVQVLDMYAVWWIRQAITRAIAGSGRTIRLPVHKVESMNRIASSEAGAHNACSVASPRLRKSRLTHA